MDGWPTSGGMFKFINCRICFLDGFLSTFPYFWNDLYSKQADLFFSTLNLKPKTHKMTRIDSTRFWPPPVWSCAVFSSTASPMMRFFRLGMVSRSEKPGEAHEVAYMWVNNLARWIICAFCCCCCCCCFFSQVFVVGWLWVQYPKRGVVDGLSVYLVQGRFLEHFGEGHCTLDWNCLCGYAFLFGHASLMGGDSWCPLSVHLSQTRSLDTVGLIISLGW